MYHNVKVTKVTGLKIADGTSSVAVVYHWYYDSLNELPSIYG